MLIATEFQATNYLPFLRSSLLTETQREKMPSCVVSNMHVFYNFGSLLPQFLFDLAFTAAALLQRETT